jgi:transposase-like protein
MVADPRSTSPDDPRGQRRALAAHRAELARERAEAMGRHPSMLLARERVTPPAYGPHMDERTHPDTRPSSAVPASAAAAAAATGPTAAQQPLPFDRLPFDDEAHHPIPFSLTARARRAVAPHALPKLTVVTDPAAHPDGTRSADPTPLPAVVDDAAEVERSDDTRAARARALRRAGTSLGRIARQLGVDELVVRAWVGEATAAASVGVGTAHSASGEEAADTGVALARAAAAHDARVRLRQDPGFAAGLGLLAGVADLDGHAITLTGGRPEVLARAVVWLRDVAGVDPAQARVVVRIGPALAGDLVRHRWATTLGIPVTRVVPTRWRGAPSPDASDGFVRFADADLATTLAGWCDALLDPDDGDPADIAF